MVAIVYFLFALTAVYGCSAAPKINQTAIDQYLQRYGYMTLQPASVKEQDNGQKEKQRQQARERAVALFQEYVGLPATGRLDDKTKERMLQPRCGNRDIVTQRDGFTYKWDKSSLRWSIVTPSRVVDTGTMRSVIKRALEIWSEVAPLDFSESSPESKPDLQVGFGRYDHGDAWPFDGPGHVLAHATFPTDGRVHFDEDEEWVNADAEKLATNPMAADLLTIAVHELGHAMGIEHLKQREAIMFPVYIPPKPDASGKIPPVKLSAYDIQAIQRIYGPGHGSRPGQPERPDRPDSGPGAPERPDRPDSEPGVPQRPDGPGVPTRPTQRPPRPGGPDTDPGTPTRPTRRPQRPPTDQPSDGPDEEPQSPPSGGPCPPFQAAVNGMQGKVYFFNGNSVWIKSNARSGSTKSSITKVFPGGPSSGVTAAVTSSVSQMTLLFKGRKVYGFAWSASSNKFALQDTFTKDLTPDVPFTPQGAFQWKDGNLVLFNGEQFVLWDDYWNKVTFKGKASDYFPGMPMDAKAEYNDGDKVYLLNGNRVAIYDTQSTRVAGTKPLSSLITC